jgi:hypothetical protein
LDVLTAAKLFRQYLADIVRLPNVRSAPRADTARESGRSGQTLARRIMMGVAVCCDRPVKPGDRSLIDANSSV